MAEPVPAFRIVFDGSVVVKQRTSRPGAQPSLLALAAILLILVASGAGGWYFWWPAAEATAPAAERREIPTLAVLPFANLSGDPTQDYFGQGLAEDIITALSNFPNLRVMSRTSSFVYDKPVKVQQVGEELGVDYVLEGSVKTADETVRVTAQLIDAKSGEHVWASRFDEEGANPVALQAEIADKINASIGGFGGAIAKSEYSAAAAGSDTNLEEYDYYLRGHALWYRDQPGDNAKARAIWQEGFAKFPDSTLLRLKVALTYYRDLVRSQSDDPPRDVDLGWKLLKEAEADDNRTQLEELIFRWVMAWFSQFHDADFRRSVTDAEATIRLAPYDPSAQADMANVMWNAGETDRAVELAEKAAASAASDAPVWVKGNLVWAYYFAGRYDDALAALEKLPVGWDYARAVIYVRLDKPGDARIAVDGILRECPSCTIEAERTWPGGKQPQMIEAVLDPYLDDLHPYLDDLRKAGMREG